MVDNVTVGSVCAQSPSFMPDLDGGKNKAQLIIDDIVAYLKNPSVYSLEKEGPLNHFVNNCSEIEPWVLIGGGLIIIVSTSEQDPEGLIVTVGDIEGKCATQIPVPPALTTSLKDIFIRPHTNAKYESFTKEQIKANIKSNVINYNCKLHFNEKPENEIVCRH
ncbi:TPA: toxin, partial [Escherichia coli]|nr:toxin [Escherichia coli]